MVSGGAGAVGAGLGAVAGATYYVVSNTLAGNQMDKAGFAGAVVEGAVMGTGVGVVARGANIAVIGAKKIMSDISTNSVRAAMGTGAVAGSINGFTQLAVKISQDKAGTNYQ